MPTNFKTYEAQSRLLVAVIASIPDLKLNFKALALHYGSDVTESALEHRFRPIKKQAHAVREAVSQGKDAKDVANVVGAGGAKNEKDIAKYYGESTPMGIEFQFRSIKRDAKSLRDAVDKGESPLKARSAATTPATGNKRKRSVFPGPANTHSGGAGHAKRQKTVVDITGDDQDDEEKYHVEQPDDTPTRPRKKAVAFPPPAAAIPTPAAIAPTAPAQTAATPDLTMEGTPSEDDIALVLDPSQATSVFPHTASFADLDASFKDESFAFGSSYDLMSHNASYYTQSASYDDDDGTA